VSARASEELAQLGEPLIVRVGSVEQVLDEIARHYHIEGLWSHQETAGAWASARNRAVARWVKTRGIPWHELPQNGVVRGLVSRRGWSPRWESGITMPIVPRPRSLAALPRLDAGTILDQHALGLPRDPCPGRESGGRWKGRALLDSFLTRRGERFHTEPSRPATAYHSCSRLSAHLAFGTWSVRELVQATRRRKTELNALPVEQRGYWVHPLSAFESRLHWHCHFIQKFESEPMLEFENEHRGWDGLREHEFRRNRFEAWRGGATGYPFVDACMRALNQTGWINFRMRAVPATFASYHLWLHWREPALLMARRFIDYELGIHYPQMQIQAGTVGTNSPRIYDPVQQSRKPDPDGAFIRRRVPELANVPDSWIHSPWEMGGVLQDRHDCRIGLHYPRPVVNHFETARVAGRRLGAARFVSLERTSSPFLSGGDAEHEHTNTATRHLSRVAL
jgi:deoxyribodipyrimidine photo-lyase